MQKYSYQRSAREEALKSLFEQEFHKTKKINKTTSPFLQTPQSKNKKTSASIQKYSLQLLTGIHQESNKIDTLITNASRSWKLSRMPLVDLNIMRIAIYEMLWLKPPVPFKVCIDEAIEIAKQYGTTDSGRFVNGVLHSISESRFK